MTVETQALDWLIVCDLFSSALTHIDLQQTPSYSWVETFILFYRWETEAYDGITYYHLSIRNAPELSALK